MKSASSERGAAGPETDPRFARGAEHFERAEWFLAHEVWEDLWRGLKGEDRLFVQALIQASVALHHFARGNATGAAHLRDATLAKLSLLPPRKGGIDLEAFAEEFDAALLPLRDPLRSAGKAPRLLPARAARR